MNLALRVFHQAALILGREPETPGRPAQKKNDHYLEYPVQ
jgi:hypothetical protein